MKFAAWYAIGVGTLIILQWIFFLMSGSVPQLQTAPWEIGHHISAELILALALLVGGTATLKATRWGERILSVALGMAIYSEINSPGYFAQRNQWVPVVMFAVLLLCAIWSVMSLLRMKLQSERQVGNENYTSKLL